MSLYDRVLADIEASRLKKENGGYNMIPFSFQRYSEYFEGWSPGYYIGLLGMTGSGKSKLARQWMYDMIDFSIEYKYPIKIVYFSLEDPELPVGKKVLSHYLYTRHSASVSISQLNSRIKPIPDNVLALIKKDELFWRKLDSILDVVNEITSPNGIHKKVAEVYKQYGKTHHIVVVLDNQSNITCDAEDEGNEWAAIKRLSRNIIREKFCLNGITTLAVLQCDFDTEKFTFRNAGKGSLISIEPNLASIGDAKVVARSMHYVFGLFDPSRFEISDYPKVGDYNINILRGAFRALIHLKSNEDKIAPRFGLLFDGKHEVYSQMPMVDDKDGLNKIYERIMNEERMRLSRITGKLSFGE